MSEAKKNKILIVDDKPENLMVLEGVLDGLNLEIIKAMSGNQALERILAHDFALVLLDVQMPEMDGFEIAKLMREFDRTKYVPIIFVTAINKEEQSVFKLEFPKCRHTTTRDRMGREFFPVVRRVSQKQRLPTCRLGQKCPQ